MGLDLHTLTAIIFSTGKSQNIQKFENIKENVSKSQVHPYSIKTKAVMTILTVSIENRSLIIQ